MLLILAGVSISLILDNNGIIQKSKESRNRYGEAKANEEEQLDQISSWIDKQTGDDETSINWEELIKDANSNPNKYKHPDQSSTNADVGIGTDGKPVNMDLWTYEIINTNEIRLGIREYICVGYSGYDNSKITETGEIQGKVPQYIKKDGQDEFYPVTDMCVTFMNCTNLKIAPEFPSTVTNLGAWDESDNGTGSIGTFYNCTNLEVAPKIPTKVKNLTNCFSGCTKLRTAPEIPEGVTNMSYTFGGCEKLEAAPMIPSSVTKMQGTFAGCTSISAVSEIPSNVNNMVGTFRNCTSLTTAPVIPSSVKNMSYTFSGCTKLTGNLIINASPTYYVYCFEDAATADNANLVVSGSSTILEKIIETKSTNSHITKAQ